MAVHHHGRRPGAVRDNRPDPEVHEGRRQTGRQQAHAGSRLKPLTSGKAPPDRPAFQPYWGKPAVRNERGDRGNVGIIRSPVRASILPNTRRVADFEVRLNRDPYRSRGHTGSAKWVLLSIVVDRAPSGRLRTLAAPPRRRKA